MTELFLLLTSFWTVFSEEPRIELLLPCGFGCCRADVKVVPGFWDGHENADKERSMRKRRPKEQPLWALVCLLFVNKKDHYLKKKIPYQGTILRK